MAGSAKMWAIRMPGGPTKIVKSAKPLSEDAAKKVYEQSFAKKHAKCLVDKEIPWPLLKPIDEADLAKDFSQFTHGSEYTGKNPRIVEV